MDNYIRLTFNGRKINISLLCVMAYTYICRSSFLVFARVFSATAVVGGLTLAVIFATLIIHSISDLRNICLDGIALVLLTALFFIVTLKLHPEYAGRYVDAMHEGKNGAMAIFRYGAPIYYYYIIRLFRNDEDKLYKLYKAVAFTILLFDIWALMDRSEEYQMTFGYQMEMAAILFIMVYLREGRKKVYLILSLFSIMMGVLNGSRACIIGYVVFIIMYFLWEGHINRRQVLLMTMGTMAVIAYCSRTVMRMIYNFFAMIGFHSRTLYYIAMGDVLAVDTARQDKIWPVLIDKLRKMPLFKMYGAFGDRYLLSQRWPYAHNILLEILLTFGFIIGGAFLAWMLVSFIRTMRKNKDVAGLLTIVFGCYSFCKLFFSSSFWMEPYFWAFLAMLINCGNKRKRDKKPINVLIHALSRKS